MHQLRLFLCAVQFMTRLPVPALRDFQPDWITRSARYFPLVGQLVGAISAGVLILAGHYWQDLLPPLLAVVAGVLVTGAFHEDGLADTADGLGGGQTREQRLTIMKDSRIGTYGVLALILCLGMKITALATFDVAHAALLLVAFHGVARAAAAVVMNVLPYAGDLDAAKLKPAPQGVTKGEVMLALIFAAWPLFLLPPSQAFAGLAGGLVLAVFVALLARRLIGGYTGDVLGAVEQATEVGFLLGAAAVL